MPVAEPRINADQVKAVFEHDSNLGHSASEENKSSSSYSLIDSDKNSTPLMVSPTDNTNSSPDGGSVFFN